MDADRQRRRIRPRPPRGRRRARLDRPRPRASARPRRPRHDRLRAARASTRRFIALSAINRLLAAATRVRRRRTGAGRGPTRAGRRRARRAARSARRRRTPRGSGRGRPAARGRRQRGRESSSAAVRASESRATPAGSPRSRAARPRSTAAAIRCPVPWSSACAGSTPGVPSGAAQAAAIPLATCTSESNPRRCAHGPSCPHALSDTQIRCGCRSSSSKRSSAPGRYPVSSTSAPASSASRRSASARSSSALRLPGPVSRCAAGSSGSPGGSTRSTSAPNAASVRPATGPAITRVRSSTRTPEAGRTALAPPRTRSCSASGRTTADSTRPGVARPAGPGTTPRTCPPFRTAAPAGCSAHSDSVRRAAAHPPASTTAVSSSTALSDRARGLELRRVFLDAQCTAQRRLVMRVVGVRPRPAATGTPHHPRQRREPRAGRRTAAARMPLGGEAQRHVLGRQRHHGPAEAAPSGELRRGQQRRGDGVHRQPVDVERPAEPGPAVRDLDAVHYGERRSERHEPSG